MATGAQNDSGCRTGSVRSLPGQRHSSGSRLLPGHNRSDIPKPDHVSGDLLRNLPPYSVSTVSVVSRVRFPQNGFIQFRLCQQLFEPDIFFLRLFQTSGRHIYILLLNRARIRISISGSRSGSGEQGHPGFTAHRISPSTSLYEKGILCHDNHCLLCDTIYQENGMVAPRQDSTKKNDGT